ncbi:MAG: hypothetical protein ACJAX0_001229, partial [Flavobacteriales bacterium]
SSSEFRFYLFLNEKVFETKQRQTIQTIIILTLYKSLL